MELSPADALAFRKVMAHYATGVVVISTNSNGVDHAMTANSFTSVSLEPPLVLACIDRKSRFHEAVIGQQHWAVSILPDTARDEATWFATRGRPLAGQFAGFATQRNKISGALTLKSAMASIECVTYGVHPGGDHDILVGKVVGMRLPKSKAAASPLLYYRHSLRSLMDGD